MSESALETPVEEATPEVADSEAVEELKRRNAGLQRKVQELLAAAQAARTTETPEAREGEMPEEVTTDVQTTLEAMALKIREMELEKWQAEAVKAHPEAIPFADLLVGGDKAQVLSLAEDIATRIKGGQKPAEAVEEAVEEAEAVTEPTPTTTVPAGAPEVLNQDAETDQQELARLRTHLRQNPGASWKEYLDKKLEMAAGAM